MKVGKLDVTPVVDGTARIRAVDYLRFGGDDPVHRALVESGTLELMMGGFLVRGLPGDRLLLVDADPQLATRTRNALAKELEATGALAIGPASPTSPSAGWWPAPRAGATSWSVRASRSAGTPRR